MKATGIVRKVDNLGRVVLPKELRKTLSIKEGDPIEIFVAEDSIILRPYRISCAACDSKDADLAEVGGVHLCRGCVEKFAKEGARRESD